MAKNEDALKEYGVEINDSNGQLRSTYDILVDLAPKWKTMTEAQKVSLGTTLAGVNQYKVFAAVMNNFDQAINATNDSLNSAGATARQNAIYMESLEAKVQALKTEFEKLVIGNGGLQKLAKSLVDISTGVLSLINDLGGLKTALTITIGLILILNSELAINAFNTITIGIGAFLTQLRILITTIPNAITAWKAFGAGIVSANTAMQASLGVIGLVVAAIGLAAGAYSSYKKSQDEALQASKDVINNNSEEINSLNELKKQIEDETLSREQLLNLIKNTDAYDVEMERIRDVNKLRQEAIDLIDEEAKKKAQVVVDTGQSAYNIATQKEKGGYKLGGIIHRNIETLVAQNTNFDTEMLHKEQTYEKYYNTLKEYKQAIIDLSKNAEEGTTGWKYYQDEISRVETAMADATSEHNENINTINSFNNSLRTLNLTYDKTTKQVRELTDEELKNIEKGHARFNQLKEYLGLLSEEEEALNNLKDSQEWTSEQLEAFGEISGLTAEQIEELGEKIREAIENGEDVEDIDIQGLVDEITQVSNATEEAIDVTERYNQALSNLQGLSSAFSTLSDAIAEFNNTGELSIDTLFSILSLSDEYLAVLSMENGQLSINEGMLQQLVNARINEAEAAAVEATQANLAKIAQGEYNGVLNESAAASNTSVNAASRAGQAIIASGNQATRAASMWASAWSTIANGYTFKTTSQKSAAKQEETALKNKITSYETLRKSLLNNTKAVSSGTYATKANTGAKGGNTKATKSNTDAQKANTEALQAQQKALQEEIDIYEKVISYIKDKVNDYIDELEDARDKEIDLIDEQIDKLKEQQDAEEEYWDEKINALKAQNEELESQIELEELLSNLQKAKQTKVKVYKEGKGFVYTSDQGAVSEAQQALDDYYRKKKYDEQLKQLEDFKDKAKANYDKQIDDLKDKQKRIKEQYQKEIDYYKQWLKNFQDQIDAYEKAQLRQQAIQLTGIDFEKQGWQTRLNNLGSFISAYNAKVQEMEELKKRLDAASASSPSSGGDDGGGGGGVSVTPSAPSTPTVTQNTRNGYLIYESRYKNQTDAAHQVEMYARSGKSYAYRKIGSYYYVYKNGNQKTGLTAAEASAKASQVAPSAGGKVVTFSYATGTKSVKDDQVAIVGEDPNKELVIGSKLNGQMMNLKKGTGVVNAKSTNTLAGILNQLGSMSYGNFGGGGTLAENTNNQSVTQHFSFGNISLPNVTDADSFVKELSIKFNSYAIQHGNARV